MLLRGNVVRLQCRHAQYFHSLHAYAQYHACGHMHRILPAEINEKRKNLKPFLTLQMLVKCADIGHLAAAPRTHKRWATQLEEEFFRQVTYRYVVLGCAMLCCAVLCCVQRLMLCTVMLICFDVLHVVCSTLAMPTCIEQSAAPVCAALRCAVCAVLCPILLRCARHVQACKVVACPNMVLVDMATHAVFYGVQETVCAQGLA